MSVNTWRSGPDIYFLICGNNRPAVSNSYYKPCPGCWNVPKYKFRLLLHKIFNPNVRLFYNLSCILWHQKIEEKYCHEPYCSNSRKLEISVNAWFATERKKKCVICCYALNWVKNTHFVGLMNWFISQIQIVFQLTCETILLNLQFKANWSFFIEFTKYYYFDYLSRFLIWLFGLGVWFSLRVREVPGSNPGGAHPTF